jgi:hypothetical protein
LIRPGIFHFFYFSTFFSSSAFMVYSMREEYFMNTPRRTYYGVCIEKVGDTTMVYSWYTDHQWTLVKAIKDNGDGSFEVVPVKALMS